MSTLFLIGNGFDVNCGMNTKYTDVYEKYIREKSDSNVIREFKKTISGDIENWGDFEMAMAEYAKKLSSEEEFRECVRDFATYMEQYLMVQNDDFKMMLKNEELLKCATNEFFRSLKVFYKDISHNIDLVMQKRSVSIYKGFSVVSFNYTDAFDYLWKKCYTQLQLNPPNVTHIHGVLGDGPVLGVDNIEQIKTGYKLSRRGERGFVKPVFNAQYDEQRVIDAKQKIRTASTICVFGMSLGKSDLSWRNEIIEWLENDENHHLFIYRYNVSNVKFDTIPQKMDIEDDAKEELLVEWGISDVESIYNQIHIPCGKNIFNIDKVLDEELYKINARIIAELEKEIEKGKEIC